LIRERRNWRWITTSSRRICFRGRISHWAWAGVSSGCVIVILEATLPNRQLAARGRPVRGPAFQGEAGIPAHTMASWMNGRSITTHPRDQMSEVGARRDLPRTGLTAPLRRCGMLTHIQGKTDQANTRNAAALPATMNAAPTYATTSSDATMRDRDAS